MGCVSRRLLILISRNFSQTLWPYDFSKLFHSLGRFSGWVAISRTQLHAEVTSRLLNKPVWSYIEKYLTWSSSIKTRMVAAATEEVRRRRMLVAYAIPTAPPLPSCCWISQKLTTTTTIPCSTPLLHGGTESSYRKNLYFTPCGSEIVATTAIFHPVARHSDTEVSCTTCVRGD